MLLPNVLKIELESTSECIVIRLKSSTKPYDIVSWIYFWRKPSELINDNFIRAIPVIKKL